MYRVSSSLGLTGLLAQFLLRLGFECDRRRRVGDDDGGASRHGECERDDAGCEEKREKEANVRERKGRGVVGLDIGLRYSAGSCVGIESPGDDVAFDEIEEAAEKTQIV